MTYHSTGVHDPAGAAAAGIKGKKKSFHSVQISIYKTREVAPTQSYPQSGKAGKAGTHAMKPLTCALISLFAACVCNGELLPTLPFPLPICTSTTTLTLGGTYTVTATSTVTSISISQTRTTIYTPTSVTCLSTATTLAAYPSLPGLDADTGASILKVRAASPQITLPPILPIGCPTVTVIPPTVSNAPCTRLEGGFALTYATISSPSHRLRQASLGGRELKSTVRTSTITTTKSGIATVTTTPISTQIVTETWIQPTPTNYNGICLPLPLLRNSPLPALSHANHLSTGLNYYQYLNGYNYNTDTTGLGGGGYSTSHWNGNLSYYTSGLARNINFESPNWPTGPAVCQLPGQAAQTDCSQWTVVFQGFLFASIAGNYTVHSPILAESANWQDNTGFWWGGEKAYTDYTDGNVDGAAAPSCGVDTVKRVRVGAGS
ncbi:hypothetical protein AN8775.2 [Aspergillus nidulans FGSC A4]|uniref:Uncharacterized protein n=1 Tax=Emericella nidulans (strain FGSC A4 / ATCC 38163 / CBS 112.46 / NRRL 194 / M139) TaxID=227321 RepID=Q5ASF5_EMENI|nr:hypothetical protein [Aspergillus nidulans FGSC A4]EAA60568.1 hypothetical protein AN8775.2 [Aspergillus nidulans FGSC A4]CBF78045.1 TPA: hypothetical protein ANIA_08775 [Aspergillus nidulans FGSC A4]|eukprot:XP_682044.1 hypothetical protein AN8775.2 [Aspergillus nidulans FGSC A4]